MAHGNGEKGTVNRQKLNTHGGYELALTVRIGSSSSAASTCARFVGELLPSSSSVHDAPPPDLCPPSTLHFACGCAALSMLDDAPDQLTGLPPRTQPRIPSSSVGTGFLLNPPSRSASPATSLFFSSARGTAPSPIVSRRR